MFFDILNDGIIVRVRLTPNSSSCRLNGIFTDADNQEFLKICVVNVPEKGKANKELLTFIAKKTGIAKSQCEIISGELERYKKIKITGDTVSLTEKFNQWMTENKNDSGNS